MVFPRSNLHPWRYSSVRYNTKDLVIEKALSYFMVRLFCRLLFAHLDVIDPLGDQLLTHFGGTVSVHVVINQFQVIELE